MKHLWSSQKLGGLRNLDAEYQTWRRHTEDKTPGSVCTLCAVGVLSYFLKKDIRVISSCPVFITSSSWGTSTWTHCTLRSYISQYNVFQNLHFIWCFQHNFKGSVIKSPCGFLKVLLHLSANIFTSIGSFKIKKCKFFLLLNWINVDLKKRIF